MLFNWTHTHISTHTFSLLSLSHPPHQWYYCTIWCGLSHLMLASLFLLLLHYFLVFVLLSCFFLTPLSFLFSTLLWLSHVISFFSSLFLSFLLLNCHMMFFFLCFFLLFINLCSTFPVFWDVLCLFYIGTRFVQS